MENNTMNFLMKSNLKTLRGRVTGQLDRDTSFMIKLVKNQDDTEDLFIQYGNLNSFYPCSVMFKVDRFHLHAAGIGGIDDVRIGKDDFLKGLAAMNSIETLNNWTEILSNKLNVA